MLTVCGQQQQQENINRIYLKIFKRSLYEPRCWSHIGARHCQHRLTRRCRVIVRRCATAAAAAAANGRTRRVQHQLHAVIVVVLVVVVATSGAHVAHVCM